MFENKVEQNRIGKLKFCLRKSDIFFQFLLC